jgi:hypothetical protein
MVTRKDRSPGPEGMTRTSRQKEEKMKGTLRSRRWKRKYGTSTMETGTAI